MSHSRKINTSGRNTTISILLLVLSLTTANQLWSQRDVDPAELIGTWLVNDQVTFNKLSQETKAQMDTIPVLRNQMEMLYRGRQINFTTDGSYSISLSGGQTLEGSWALSEDVLTLTDAQGRVLGRQVRQINNNRMILLSPGQRNDNIVPVPEIHYTKL
jgi:hypothetical protein